MQVLECQPESHWNRMFLNSKTGIQLAQSVILAINSEKEKTHKNRNLDHHTHNHTDTALDTSFLCAFFSFAY